MTEPPHWLGGAHDRAMRSPEPSNWVSVARGGAVRSPEPSNRQRTAHDQGGCRARSRPRTLVVMTQLVGAHVGQVDPVAYAQGVGANFAQIFLGDPQSW